MPPHPNASPQPDDWLDQALHQAFAAELGVGPPVVAEIEDIEDVLAAVPLAEGGATASQGNLWLALAPGSRYEVLGEAARGGLGIVYRGHDRDLGREVALKALDRRLAADPGFVRRFVAEARVCGRLQHPGVVPVHELGLDQTECPYFVMKMITGQTFAEVLAARITPTDDRRRCLDAFEKVCHTIAYAHDQGVVHRDLKPANVMIGAFGEVQVVDWGLALVLTQSQDRASDAVTAPAVIAPGRAPSVAGAVSGTPAYMPPEQARGETPSIDARSDVFALGAMLAEILTGRPVHTRELDTRLQIDRTARGDFSLVQRRLHECGAESDLVALALACLAPAMADRPASAAVVAKSIGDHLAAVEDRSRRAQLRAVAARANARATLVIASLVVVMLSAASGAFLWWRESEHRRGAEAVAQVDAAAAEVVRLAERARASEGLGLGPWDQARLAAQQAVQLAEALPVSAEMRARMGQMESELRRDQEAAQLRMQRRQRDQHMVQSLLEVRIPETELSQNQQRRNTALRYGELFTSYLGGRDLWALSVDDAVEALQSEIQPELAAALDLWSLALSNSTTFGPSPTVEGSGIWSLALYLTNASDMFVEKLQAISRRLDPGDPWRNKLRDLIREFDSVELARITKDVGLESLSVSTAILLAELSSRSGEVQQGIAIYQQACAIHPSDVGVTIGAALQLTSADALEPAVGFWRIARALAPQNPGIHHQLGSCLRKLQRDDEAVPCYQQALEINPMRWASAADLQVVFLRLGKYDAAATVIEQCASSLEATLISEPQSVGLRLSLACVCRVQGRSMEAVEHLRALLSYPEFGARNFDPDFAAIVHEELGRSLRTLMNYEEAIAWYRKSLRRRPLNPTINSLLGEALSQSGEIDEGEGFLRRAIALDPRDGVHLIRLCNAFLRWRTTSEAGILLQRALSEQPMVAIDLLAALEDEVHLGTLEHTQFYVAAVRRYLATFPAEEQKEIRTSLIRFSRLVDAHSDKLFQIANDIQATASAEELRFACRWAARNEHFLIAARAYNRLLTDHVAFCCWPNRSEAAIYALLAAKGAMARAGSPSSALSSSERAALRLQAFNWLRADLEECISSDRPEQRNWFGNRLMLDALEEAAQAEVSPEEAAAFEALWREMQTAVEDK
jgi:tetratricopeptide (TPR) repeat protein